MRSGRMHKHNNRWYGCKIRNRSRNHGVRWSPHMNVIFRYHKVYHSNILSNYLRLKAMLFIRLCSRVGRLPNNSSQITSSNTKRSLR